MDTAPTPFKRYQNATKFSKDKRAHLLKDYFDFYRAIFRARPELLNQKMPRAAMCDLLDTLGATLNAEARKLSSEPGSVRDFLEGNPLPASMADNLDPEFRADCLILNALKQWVSAEQLATDQFLLGGNARAEIKSVAAECVITGSSLADHCNLHHPVRDGRPPIPISRSAHAKLEGQGFGKAEDERGDPTLHALQPVRGRNRSWANLRRGCLELMGEHVCHSTPAVRAGSRQFAREAVKLSGLQPERIVQWLASTGRGEPV